MFWREPRSDVLKRRSLLWSNGDYREIRAGGAVLYVSVLNCVVIYEMYGFDRLFLA